MSLMDTEEITPLCHNCGHKLRQVGAVWTHLDHKINCPRKFRSDPVFVAWPTEWLETEAGEPF